MFETVGEFVFVDSWKVYIGDSRAVCIRDNWKELKTVGKFVFEAVGKFAVETFGNFRDR